MELRPSRSAFAVSLKEEADVAGEAGAGAAISDGLVTVAVHPMIPKDIVASPTNWKTCFIEYDVSVLIPLQAQSSADFPQAGDEFSLQEGGNSLLYPDRSELGITASQHGNNQSGMPEVRAKSFGRREFLRYDCGMPHLFCRYLFSGESPGSGSADPQLTGGLSPGRGFAFSCTRPEERISSVCRHGAGGR